MKFRSVAAFLFPLIFASCVSTKVSEYKKPESVIDKMTLEEKIGQMFLITPESLIPSYHKSKLPVLSFTKEMEQTLSEYPAGGIVLFKENIKTPAQTKSLIQQLQKASKIPLFISIDEEGGRVSRISGNENFFSKKIPSAMEIACGPNGHKNVRNISSFIGSYLYQYGFNVDFAPVADVWSNPENTVIGDRAFSTDPRVAAQMIRFSIEGFHRSKMLCSIKHYPGHGDTKNDTHHGAASSFKTWEQIQECEMIPFKQGIKSGTDMIMVAHILTPNATTDNLPATLSETWINQRLRNEMGYQGVVITDAMNMKAVTLYFPDSADAAVKAINAGIDIVLMPEDYVKAFNGVRDAVQKGIISEERIDQSVERILNLKKKI